MSIDDGSVGVHQLPLPSPDTPNPSNAPNTPVISTLPLLPSKSSAQLPPSPAPTERPIEKPLKRSQSPDPSWPSNNTKTRSSPHRNNCSLGRELRPPSNRLASFAKSKSSSQVKSALVEAVVSTKTVEVEPILHFKDISSQASQENMSKLASVVSTAKMAVEASTQTTLALAGDKSVSPKRQRPTLQSQESCGSGWTIAENIKRLTNFLKSGPPTPRALSVSTPLEQTLATPNNNRGSDSSNAISRSATPKPASSTGAPAVAKGKLKVRIVEARGLGKCREPHVVAVFQRSQLISGPAHPCEPDMAAGPPLNRPIPMQRTGSSQGRFPHGVPMRSRQSSNSSVTEAKVGGSRKSLTNIKWDAQAIFDVVNSDTKLDISVYERDDQGNDIFYGHVTFDTRADKQESIKGWFALEGHADTPAPTGEIYVEANYQRAERKHLGPSDFEILRLIGKGTFGQVYQVRKKDTQRIYAMKVLSKKVIVQKKEVAHTVGERNILVRTAMSDSPFIVGLKFSFQTPSDLYLVTDYMSGGELFWHLQKENKFGEARAKFYIAELILAIQHLHENDIVYRDLKPENILLDANGHIALCDFGLSKANLTKNDTTTTFCGTTEYLAPEVLLDESGYTKMVDFWSLGVLVFEMCCGWSPFYADDTQQMYKNIAFGKVRFPRDVLSVEGRSFVKGLLNRNPKHRLGAHGDAEELKGHPFFSDINWDQLARKLITPPFKPTLLSDTDVSYFDPEFTTALDNNGSLNARAAALARGIATSTPLSPSVQANFQGFTYVDESALEENMGGGGRGHGLYNRYDNDESDEDDVHSDMEDGWDNMSDVNLHRNRNRMSGIEHGSNDDDMLDGQPFDPLS
ncbi:serine/threonine-protein kinase sck1 [Ceratocystis lukuohia]|uniref:Serine/threonine-protein kinase sck1 n=1 Tax=Ceratocystis lukuohia TaxID=2019550 RepID=A0ABR4MB30_9PEZI